MTLCAGSGWRGTVSPSSQTIATHTSHKYSRIASIIVRKRFLRSAEHGTLRMTRSTDLTKRSAAACSAALFFASASACVAAASAALAAATLSRDSAAECSAFAARANASVSLRSDAFRLFWFASIACSTDFTDAAAAGTTQMSFAADETLVLIEKAGIWWKARKLDGSAEGLVPSNYVKEKAPAAAAAATNPFAAMAADTSC